MNFNLIIFYWLNNFSHRNGLFDSIVSQIAQIGDTVVFGLVIVFFIYLFFVHQDWKNKKWIAWVLESATVVASVVIAWATSYVIKILVHAPRPFINDINLKPLFTHGAYDSFPSGHATVFFALAVIIYDYHKPAGYFFFVCALLIAISRVISGIHYPVDILVGAIIGIFLSSIIFNYLNKHKAKIAV